MRSDDRGGSAVAAKRLRAVAELMPSRRTFRQVLNASQES